MCRIVFIVSSMQVGGAERVASTITNYIALHSHHEVHMILLSKNPRFFELAPNIKIYEPNENVGLRNRIISIVSILRFVRLTLKRIKPNAVLSFGGKYNSFSILSSLLICKKIIVSDRSRPGKSYGIFVDCLNLLLYRFSKGIIVQTNAAKSYFRKRYPKLEITVIPNPFPKLDLKIIERDRIILNVGRFIKSKNQDLLIEIFIELNPEDWQLWFIGSGSELERCQKMVEIAGFTDRIIFLGNRKDVVDFYMRSEIFAFISSSEGFPNVLGEAMSAGCACVSYDCLAGPSDLIDTGINGYLIEEGNVREYRDKLRFLMENSNIRQTFGKNATAKMSSFEDMEICRKYMDVLCK